MSIEENKEIALSLIEALNTRDLSLWSRHLSEDYAAEHPGVSVLLDKARSIAYHQRFVTAFPDIRFEVLGVISEGDSALVQWTASGTHSERLATITGQTTCSFSQFSDDCPSLKDKLRRSCTNHLLQSSIIEPLRRVAVFSLLQLE